MESLKFRGNQFAADRYRARAQRIRGTAAEGAGPTVQRQLLQIAEEYDWLAEAVEHGAVGLILTNR